MKRSLRSAQFKFWIALPLTVLFWSAKPAVASKKPANTPKSEEHSNQALDDYVRQAMKTVPVPSSTLGSLWNGGGSLANMARDDKALQVGDLVTINIMEVTTASASGTSKASRAFSASSGINAFFGMLNPKAKITNLFSPQSQDSLNGSAATSSNHLLSTNLTGAVAKVLPNGYLVVQAAREVEIDNQVQHVVVRGIVRPSDLAPDNSVLSTSVANLQVEVSGKGVITDETRPPNVVTRFLLKLLAF